MAGLYLVKGVTGIRYTAETVMTFNLYDVATKQTRGLIEVIADVRLSVGETLEECEDDDDDPGRATFLRLYWLHGGDPGLLRYTNGDDEYAVKRSTILYD
jgi:hypothetical protein